MEKDVFIIDNFYGDPDLVRQLAIQSDYVSGAKYNYPGYQSKKQFYTKEIVEKIENVTGVKITDINRFTFGAFRMITQATGTMPKVHADSVIDWAGLVFLTPNAPKNNGMGFYKHLETGFEGPPTDKEARFLGFEDANEFERQVVRRDMADLSKWELTSVVEPVYNRMVLFRGSHYYHAPIGGRGTNPQDSRITQNFFFNEALSV
ncbi:DUF6445 family protein [Paenibacillus sp. FSL H7-0940]|uniref:DUF6445 family protein n=1 Tax=Paenibacillus sp. FSL H7-0940 TaxID=2921443 RepID=UPI0030EDD56E